MPRERAIKHRRKRDPRRDLEVAMQAVLEFGVRYPDLWHPIRDIDANSKLAIELLAGKGAVQIDEVRNLWKLWRQPNEASKVTSNPLVSRAKS
jgi:hypothetical protein